jgi:hypothetical protein
MTTEPGKQRLLDDLNAKPQSDDRDRIITLAGRGVYSDFGSSSPFPVTMLVQHLQNAGFVDLASKAAFGEYDHNY